MNLFWALEWMNTKCSYCLGVFRHVYTCLGASSIFSAQKLLSWMRWWWGFFQLVNAVLPTRLYMPMHVWLHTVEVRLQFKKRAKMPVKVVFFKRFVHEAKNLHHSLQHQKDMYWWALGFVWMTSVWDAFETIQNLLTDGFYLQLAYILTFSRFINLYREYKTLVV